MALLYGYDVRMQVVEGGSVIIEALPSAAPGDGFSEAAEALGVAT